MLLHSDHDHVQSSAVNQQAETIVLSGKETIQIAAYSQLRVEVEEINWNQTKSKVGAYSAKRARSAARIRFQTLQIKEDSGQRYSAAL